MEEDSYAWVGTLRYPYFFTIMKSLYRKYPRKEDTVAVSSSHDFQRHVMTNY